MISGLFSCSEKAIETDLYGPRSDIRNGRHSGRQFRKIQAESKVKSRGRANPESIPSPPMKWTRQGPFSLVEYDRGRTRVQDNQGGFVSGCTMKRTPGKPQSRSEARDSGAEGVLDSGILPPSPPYFCLRYR